MKQVLTDIVKSIVDNPDEVVVLEKVSGDMSILELSVAKEDMGKVIGRQGRVAKMHPHGDARRGRQGEQARHSRHRAGVMRRYLEAGRLNSPRGIKGELRFACWCDSPEFLEGVRTFYLDAEGMRPLRVVLTGPRSPR